ncbi:hypothetical protein [Mycolicibacterium goodii]|uniref:hypothetical protein n=1 Tax=Mycolicibacterium goodii TaxID=134601 RepID=UPI0012FFA807
MIIPSVAMGRDVDRVFSPPESKVTTFAASKTSQHLPPLGFAEALQRSDVNCASIRAAFALQGGMILRDRRTLLNDRDLLGDRIVICDQGQLSRVVNV